MNSKWCFVVCLTSLLVNAQEFPSAPRLVYRGVLAAGSLPGQPRFKVTIWKSASTFQVADRLCDPPFIPVTVEASRFEVALDESCIAGMKQAGDAWVQVSIEGVGDLLPRAATKSVPFALKAEQVGLAWRTLTPINGWASHGGASCKRAGDSVFLNFSINRTGQLAFSAANAPALTLPAECRPATDQFIPVVAAGDSGAHNFSTVALVKTDGAVVLSCPTQTNPTFCDGSANKDFTASVVFQAAP